MFKSQNDIKTENPFDNICSGCLTSERTLRPLSDDLELYSRLLGVEENEDKYSNLFHCMLCWECRAVLRKLHKFQAQIQTAYCILSHSLHYTVRTEYESLSNLRMINIDCCNYNEHLIIKDETKDLDDIDNSLIDKLQSMNDSDSYMDLIDDEVDIKLEETDESKDDNSIQSKMSKECNKKEKSIMKHFERITKSHKINMKHCTEIVLNEAEFKHSKVEKRNSRIRSRLDRLYKCNECGTEFDKESDLVEHNVKLHLNSYPSLDKNDIQYNKQYKCNFCDNVSLTMKAQIRHLRSFHRVLYQCKLCEDVVGNRRDIRPHYYDKHREKYICDHCGKIVTDRNTFIKHVRTYHASTFTCSLCAKTFESYHKLYRHTLMIHGIGIRSRKQKKNDVSENTYCVECNKQYSSIHQYKKHLNSSVKHKPRKKLSVPCPHCGKVFTRTAYMNNHSRLVHQGIRRNHCDLCNKSFTTGFALRKHIQFVHDKVELPRDKICNLCGRGFRDRKVLNNHILTHTGERPHQCPQCPAKFTQRVAMTTHLKNIHLKRASINLI